MLIVGLQFMIAAMAVTLAGVRGEATAQGSFAWEQPTASVSVSGCFLAAEPPPVDLDLPDYSAAQAAPVTVLTDSARPAHSSTVHRVPPVPSSAAMFLSAVLSVGAWHAVRSARHLHAGPVPEWYHTGGPIQVGHAVPYDFHAEWTCHAWDRPELDPSPSGVARRNQDEAKPSGQDTTSPFAPRGPPANASSAT